MNRQGGIDSRLFRAYCAALNGVGWRYGGCSLHSSLSEIFVYLVKVLGNFKWTFGQALLLL